MYKGFILDSDLIQNRCNSKNTYISFEHHKISNELKDELKEIINENLNRDGTINAEIFLDDFFPQINEFHAFISHSHNDRKIAINFSKWLESNFGIKAFIDSEYWKYFNDLIEKLMEKYSDSKNDIASHVHNMLSTSLAKMIDSCEVFFFIGSNSSLNDFKATLSPWIYSELQLTKILRKKIPERMRNCDLTERFEASLESLNESKRLRVKYPALLSELRPLNENILEKWERSVKDTRQPSSLDSLDKLYSFIANYQ